MGDSIDGPWRKQGENWFPELEGVGYRDLQLFREVEEVDILVTHVPPTCIVRLMIPGKVSSSSRAIDALWKGLGIPTLVCGHMHESKTIEIDEIRYWQNAKLMCSRI